LNVSQFINEARVGEACRLLRETDLQITQIIYASGFNTKSNFNREFVRVTSSTPSEWRARHKG
jgi:AraC-like DNA-binding protein